MKRQTFLSTVINGHLTSYVTHRMSEAIRSQEGKSIRITVEGTKRSTKQNSYLHGVVFPILADYWGYTHEEAKSAIKFKFLLDVKIDEKTGLEIEFVRNTSSLSKEETINLIEDIRQWAKDFFDVHIPKPEKIN